MIVGVCAAETEGKIKRETGRGGGGGGGDKVRHEGAS